MPIYEYQCAQCGSFEEIHSGVERLSSCPRCGRNVKRIYGAFSVQYKCKGFYTTDNAVPRDCDACG